MGAGTSFFRALSRRVMAVRASPNRQARELRLEPAGRLRRMAIGGPVTRSVAGSPAQAAPYRMVELSLNGHRDIATGRMMLSDAFHTVS